MPRNFGHDTYNRQKSKLLHLENKNVGHKNKK